MELLLGNYGRRLGWALNREKVAMAQKNANPNRNAPKKKGTSANRMGALPEVK
ncbi:MAG: hypothetical protein JOZ78_03145 [Chroococcidiopsidaceae cyanobacterium CP_BM_ER_R8_30]|nr:hypothetical protein [Chroococcidiopsidaceae cyanobacterium CP_BM_ER_R8_30]